MHELLVELLLGRQVVTNQRRVKMRQRQDEVAKHEAVKNDKQTVHP